MNYHKDFRLRIFAGLFAIGLCASAVNAVSAGEAKTGPASPGGLGQLSLPFPSDASTINIIEWDANALPRIYERSDQLPLSDDEVRRLVEAKMPEEMIVKMIEQRRCACDASPDNLIAMRAAGVSDPIIVAVSTHSLRPNRHLDFSVTFDFDGDSRIARQRYLYVFIEDGDLTRVFSADLGALLSSERRHDAMVDQSDLLITRTVRRIQLAGQIPLKTYGKRQVLVVSSANPGISHPSQLTEKDLSTAQSYVIDYPRSSIMSVCRLHVGYRRDVMIAHQWHFAGSRFECEWD